MDGRKEGGRSKAEGRLVKTKGFRASLRRSRFGQKDKQEAKPSCFRVGELEGNSLFVREGRGGEGRRKGKEGVGG